MMRFRFQLLASALVAIPCVLAAQEVVPGDTLHVRLLDRVANDHRARADVRALVIAPIVRDGRVVVPPGSIVTGRVLGAGVEKYGGRRHWIDLRLDGLAMPIGDAGCDTVRASLSARLAAVDDSREGTDSAGRIIGPRIPSILHSKPGWALAILGVFHPVGALVMAAALVGERAERHRAIVLGRGTELTAIITSRTALGDWPSWTPPPQVTDGVNPDTVAASSPLQTHARAGRVPGDIISIALVGSAAQVSAAFSAAGWTSAVPMTAGNELITAVKAAVGKGFLAQPMSKLALGGRPPDAEYEKVADTFTKRHHLRLWRWPTGTASESESTLRVIAATRDIGLIFSTKHRSLTHRVDPHIDDERDKIVSDLIAANAVAAVSYVARAAPPGGTTVNFGGSQVVTDWRMAVVVLKSPRAVADSGACKDRQPSGQPVASLGTP
ncbi:MAG: LssY C-terminal domain-containing protein [Gemmatimonadaceae bacterium]|nr:LssY C-terminal domain-containing protein [Gemmatimonadaceae bacterium]